MERDDLIFSGSRLIQAGSKRIASGSGHIATGSELIATGSKRIASGSERIVSGSELIVSGSERIAAGSERIVSGSERIVSGRDLVAGRKQGDAGGVVLFWSVFSGQKEVKTMSSSKTSIAERLNAARVAISNSLGDAEIASLAANFGYSAEKLNEGYALYEAAVAASNAADATAGGQETATEEALKAQTAAQAAYQDLAKVARAVFKNEESRLTSLGLKGSMPRTTAGFLAAAETLFENAASAPSIAEYGYSPEKLESELAKVRAYGEADQRQEAAKGEAQNASASKLSALQSLDEWLAQYLKIARVALRGKPQLLEKLGVTARTSKTAAQRAAAKKLKTPA